MELPDNILYRLSNIRKTYATSEAGLAALDLETLEIPANQVVVILGESGSGKTTLLNLIGMLDRPDQQYIAADGTPRIPSILFNNRREAQAAGRPCHDLVTDRAAAAALRRKAFGFVFQEGYLLKNLTSLANIKIPLFINGLDPAATPAAGFLDTVDLPAAEYGGRLPAELSGGEAQRVAIIRSIIHNPAVIIADEPSSRLDSRHGRQVMELLTGWCHARKDRSLIWVTHNQELARELAEHIIVLKDGKVVESTGNHPVTMDPATAHMVRDSAPDAGAAILWNEIPARLATSAWANTLRFIVFFAISDIFPARSGIARRGISRLLLGFGRSLQSLAGIRKTQGLNILSLFMVLLLAFFFSHASVWLKNYFVWSVSHPRINNITVNSKKHGDTVLSHDDMKDLAALAWTGKPGRGPLILPWNETTAAQGNTLLRPAVIGAFGSRDRLIDVYFNQEASDRGWNDIVPLDLVVMDNRDPMLGQIELLNGTRTDSADPTGRMLSRLFAVGSTGDSNDAGGIIVTRETLAKDLGYTGPMPSELSIDLNSKKQSLRLLGVADWLPFGAGAMVSAGWYERQFLALGPADPLPGYDRITIYIQDMLADGLPVATALIDLGFQTTDNIRNRLIWIKNLTDFISWFALLSILGIAVLVAGTLMVSYTQTIRKKQKEIGVLLAHGTRKWILHAIFLLEISIVWLMAVAMTIPLHRLGSLFMQRFLVDKFALDQATITRVFLVPGALYWAIFGSSLLLAWLSVGLALHRTIQGQVAEILKFTD